jgi:CTP synthase
VKYIFITGGVVSSVGKGLTAAALGALLEEAGYCVRLQKFDPYLNVDPGTMNPYQHGEVYVLDDGAECDLDLGHYERFTSQPLSRQNNLTAGQVYETLISRERRGDFLGQTVQVIPHVTGVIKERLALPKEACDILITEIGGTVGDIEGLPFLEAIRQWALEVGRENVAFVHVSLLPYVAAAGELKSKPTQMSVAKLREIGIQPDALICRVEKPMMTEGIRQKLSMFCNVEAKAVIEEADVQRSIYELPHLLHREGMDRLLLRRLGLPEGDAPVRSRWSDIVERIYHPTQRLKVAVVGKYMEIQDAYKSVFEALHHAAISHSAGLEILKVDAEQIERDGAQVHLAGVDGILVPGGFGARGIEGKIMAARYARERGIPYLGLCLGLQIAAIEFARNVLGLKAANSTEFDPHTPDPVVYRMAEQEGVSGKGGTMRLGAYRCRLLEGTRAAAAYGHTEIRERHRHRYEFNSERYRSSYEQAGMRVAGVNPERGLVEILELEQHPFFVGVQFHPEFLSKPTAAHPLFAAFVAAGLGEGASSPLSEVAVAP